MVAAEYKPVPTTAPTKSQKPFRTSDFCLIGNHQGRSNLLTEKRFFGAVRGLSVSL